MKLKMQKASKRGRFQNNWLNARYSFSFVQYFSLEWLQFKSLWVLNHDQIQPHSGFYFHSHQDNDEISLQEEEGVYIYNIEGSLTVLENQTLSDCDGLAIVADKDESLNISLKSLQNTHFIAFKMR
ncbi:MAG: hypothetical protein MK008_12765 [Bdellovibrionales bacterium]|nr:hypothetical protein [Bdellovibrionales bacterium]